ncbi:hypothetical protein BU17DRAFT_94208 [Hysterangium stoloniferum]|nr:hypothetical protein BU17DRAFT_94208 [Hysterangium stoloniferum]
MPFDNLPNFNELPSFSGLPGCAWEVWGKGDELGTVNLLTDDVVARAAKEEIKSGKTVTLSWREAPMFGREAPKHSIQALPYLPAPTVNDDTLHMNTQSGSQWDGLRHVGLLNAGCFYQGVRPEEILKGPNVVTEGNVDPATTKLGIHNWAQHGICGRGVLVDLVRYFTDDDTKPLPYDPFTTHPISVGDIKAAAKQQGVEFRQGDILLLRMGFMQKFMGGSDADRAALAGDTPKYAGLKQGLEMKEFLWNTHFAAVASDMPALECWPAPSEEGFIHETIIALWGMPIGEFFDLEGVAKVAKETGRYTFYFSSWPLYVFGGVASPPNAAATF